MTEDMTFVSFSLWILLYLKNDMREQVNNDYFFLITLHILLLKSAFKAKGSLSVRKIIKQARNQVITRLRKCCY